MSDFRPHMMIKHLGDSAIRGLLLKYGSVAAAANGYGVSRATLVREMTKRHIRLGEVLDDVLADVNELPARGARKPSLSQLDCDQGEF